jgi:hypothetical protein
MWKLPISAETAVDAILAEIEKAHIRTTMLVCRALTTLHNQLILHCLSIALNQPKTTGNTV